MIDITKAYPLKVMKRISPLSFNQLISINISAGANYTLMFLEPSLTATRCALMRLFVRWPGLSWSAVLFVYKMQSTITRLLAAAHTHIPLAFSNIYFGICLYRHSLVRASWARCCLSVLISSQSSHAYCSAFAFLKK